MTGKEMKAVMEYRGKMAGYLQSGVILEAAEDWIRMELHNQKREIQSEVAADMRKEKSMKRERPAGQGESKLRRRLIHLIVLILSHPVEKAKGRI